MITEAYVQAIKDTISGRMVSFDEQGARGRSLFSQRKRKYPMTAN